jgi:hypothetical protein
MWAWLDRLKTYVNQAVGRILNRATVRSIGSVNHVVNTKLGDAATQDLLADSITAAQWEQRMRTLIKNSYIEQYLLGRGGKENTTRRDYSSIGGMLKEQYKYLRKFAQEIESGNLSPGAIANRSRMYVNSSREAFERAQRRALSNNGTDLGKMDVHWNLGLAEHCDDCVAFEGLGWIPADKNPFGGAFPGSGDTKCLTNCKCMLSYRNRDTGEPI